MVCPSCNHPLQEKIVKTDTGKFTVEHCTNCGGTWFDAYEINRISEGEAGRIAAVGGKKAPIHRQETMRCPKDHEYLAGYHHASIPHDIPLFSCPACHGIFALREALLSFKKQQTTTIASFKEPGRIFPALSVVFVPAFSLALLFAATFALLHLTQAPTGEMLPQEPEEILTPTPRQTRLTPSQTRLTPTDTPTPTPDASILFPESSDPLL